MRLFFKPVLYFKRFFSGTGNSLTGSDRSGGAIPGYHHIRSTLLRPTVDNFDMMEYPFLTMSKYPPGFILHLGNSKFFFP